MSSTAKVVPLAQSEGLSNLLASQRKAFAADPMPTVRQRKERLKRLHNALLTYRELLIDATSEDFGGRAREETMMTEILPVLEAISFYRSNVRQFMKVERRPTPLVMQPVRLSVQYQPLGVVGIVVPWNFPTFLSLSPLVGALAAGNRAMIKASEYAPATAALLQQMIAETFDSDEVTVITGDADVAAEFTSLPFDHLVFTGSTAVGRIVMRAAAENLTPVTLELGGKSPAIVHESFPLAEAASRIAFGKAINAGQACVAPDYVLVPRDQVDAFCDAFGEAIAERYPSLADNADFTAIINERQRSRLQRYLEDAREKGAALTEVNPADESFDESAKLPFTIVRNATDDMLVMQEEIFGPILPVVPYDTLDEAVDFVNARPRPLALYYFDYNSSRTRKVLSQTHSGGVSVNDTLTHVAAENLPFGGIGPSGMGHYHGREGFLTFSKAKSVLRKGRFDPMRLIGPPWGRAFYNLFIKFQLWRFRRLK